MSEDRRNDLSFAEIKDLYRKNSYFIGIQNQQDLQYLVNQGFQEDLRLHCLEDYKWDTDNKCIWLCHHGYSKKEDNYSSLYITIKELMELKDRGLYFVKKMLEIVEKYENREL